MLDVCSNPEQVAGPKMNKKVTDMSRELEDSKARKTDQISRSTKPLINTGARVERN